MRKLAPVFLLLACAVLVPATVSMACQVPVFRYALERWQADPYQVIVISSGQLDQDAEASLRRLKSAAAEHGANFEVTHTEAASLQEDEGLLELWQRHQPQGQDSPLMIVLYPHTAMQVPDRLLMTSELSSDSVARLLHSPAREDIARRLSEGQTAVWIFVPSGKEAKDEAAMLGLKKRIAASQESLTVPSAEVLDIAPERLENNEIPLRIEFSIVTLDRQDPEEAFLLAALAGSEPDLAADQPQAFPVFGRGRVLYALVGRGIMPATVDTACKFIAGPCSCQVKNMNPGFDLLLSYRWDDAVAGSMISDALPQESEQPVLLTIPPGR